jgi:transcriptional regulator with XRE-family HTH domain
VKRLAPGRIRKIRQGSGLSKKEFGRNVWAAERTVARWESGRCVPVGIHYRLLILLEQHLTTPFLRVALRDPRALNPMFLVYRLLKLVYRNNGT